MKNTFVLVFTGVVGIGILGLFILHPDLFANTTSQLTNVATGGLQVASGGNSNTPARPQATRITV